MTLIQLENGLHRVCAGVLRSWWGAASGVCAVESPEAIQSVVIF
jgi:hypothetical protein